MADVGVDKSTYLGHGLAGLWEEGSADRVTVKHALANPQRDIDTGSSGLFGKAGRVIAQEFVAAGIDEERGKPPKIAIKRGYPG
jgi:hypothetical protein